MLDGCTVIFWDGRWAHEDVWVYNVFEDLK